MDYPPAPRHDVVEDVHGQPVADLYRWLEDPGAADTVAWVDAQSALSRRHLDSLPGRERLRRHLHQLLEAGSVTVPRLRRDRAFFERRGPGQEHAVLLVREADGTERVLLDPSALSPDDAVTLDGWAPSEEGERLAYLLSEAGDEEAVLWVMDVTTGEVVDGPVDRTRYGSVAWLPGGKELYYVRRLPPEAVPAGEEQFHRRVYRHTVGTDSDNDELVFGEGRDKIDYYSVLASPDGRWLLIAVSPGTAPRNDLYVADLRSGGPFVTVQEDVDAWTAADFSADGLLYLLTTRDAPRRRLAVADPEAPLDWRALVPESDAVIEDFALTTDAVVVARTVHAVSTVTVHDRHTGAVRRTVPLPGLGSTTGITSRRGGGEEAWIGYTDFTTPPQVHLCDTASGVVKLWEEAPGHPVVGGVAASQVTYASKDGTEVRMFVLRGDEDVSTDGPRPTILYGYGGFDVALTPQYSAGILAWLSAGGTYAIANLRGGSEEGEEWHRAGMREHKQNVFDDFVAAAEWLVGNGVTSPDMLGINGGSNGGLLVGAALTQRPDLFAAVVCSAPLLDMVRYERFGLGASWSDEYGSAADPDEAEWLLSYSPYHHVREGARYPSVLFTVFESDTRVDPLHARKMCAALQWATSAPPDDRPILYRSEARVGHAARSVSRTEELLVDITSFLAERLGLRLPEEAPA